MTQYDIVISGGAMAGATLALALANQCPALSIAVIEAQLPTQTSSGFDARSIALAHGSVAKLKALKLWHLLADHACPIMHIHVSDRGHAGMTRIHANERHVDALGQVVELSHVGKVYHALMAQTENITFIAPDAVVAIKAYPDQLTLTLQSGDVLSARLLVGADGGQSTIAQLQGLRSINQDYSQTAIIANVKTSVAHQGWAYERFTPHGPIALLPMTQERSALVWCVKSSDANTLMAMHDDDFLPSLQMAFGWRLGAMTHVGQRTCYPLSLSYHPQVIHHRTVLVGNAAQSLHPIAGQGFNLGLRDIAALVDIVRTESEPLGSNAQLQRYQLARKADREKTISLTSGLVSLFSNSAPPLIAARNWGLIAMEQCGWLQAPLVEQTLGWRR
ncbi:2-octaprenyl-6-methoxyphenyl hydroxylase [Thaumasiovibrio sp. DFM-14]|uniref:2-octaprenyl-6-methoxyphenyl hydroxylase n=1 Tax=Thaumasiovibrio sp. DFM-14 TaxID=3384792 RepID=UPI0039A09C52